MLNNGILIVLSGPSGVGKDTIIKKIINKNKKFKYSISMTTRLIRNGEVNGKDYFFCNKNEFKNMIKKNKMLEYAKYLDNYYGTPFFYVNNMLKKGYNVFLDIDVNGAKQIKNKINNSVLIFLLPPNLLELRSRIINRGVNNLKDIEKRMGLAKKEIKKMIFYDYILTNKTILSTVNIIKKIIFSEKFNSKRVISKYLNIFFKKY